MTGCQCTEEGFCQRHKVWKSKTMVQFCQTNAKWFAAWEEGRGPGQEKPGLGDMVSHVLGKIGITPERYMDAKAALGLPRTCGCCGRRKKLNELGKKLGIG